MAEKHYTIPVKGACGVFVYGKGGEGVCKAKGCETLDRR